MLTARMALAVLGSAVERWIADGCTEDLEAVVNADFELAVGLCTDLVTTEVTRT